ncbi:MAG: ribonuclease P protein component [Magnetococcales bacterium]|nr:ribonuclease P protein component [Magnetococcales bacterium]
MPSDLQQSVATSEEKTQGFPKDARLLVSRDFTAVMRQGRRKGNALFLLHVWLRPGARCRLGLTVSRKVGNAVVRNRVKRVAREYFRQRQAQLRPGCACVLVARATAGGVDNVALACALDELFKPWFAPVGGTSLRVVP